MQRIPSGYFSQPNTIHVHVDGGAADQLIQAIVASLNGGGALTKKTSIQDFIAGPQRGDPNFEDTYSSHTPKTDGREYLEYFSTTLFGNWEKTVTNLRLLLGTLKSQPGMVVEVERVVGKIEDAVQWSNLPFHNFP